MINLDYVNVVRLKIWTFTSDSLSLEDPKLPKL